MRSLLILALVLALPLGAQAPAPARAACTPPMALATTEAPRAAKRAPTESEVTALVRWCSEPTGGHGAVIRVRGPLPWTLTSPPPSSTPPAMTFDCPGAECLGVDLQLGDGAARRYRRATIDPARRFTAAWALAVNDSAPPTSGVRLPMDSLPALIQLSPTDSSGWWEALVRIPPGVHFRGLLLRHQGLVWALPAPPEAPQTGATGAQPPTAPRHTSLSLVANGASGGPVVYDPHGVVSLGVNARYADSTGRRTAHVALRPETVLRPWEPLEADPNRRFPRSVPENRPDLAQWRPAAGAFLFLDTPRADATGAVATVHLASDPLGLRALATEDGHGRLSVGALALGEPLESPLAVRGALLRLDPRSGAEGRWPWAYSADVTASRTLALAPAGSAIGALGDSARLGRLTAGWTTTGSRANLTTRAEALLVAITTPIGPAAHLQLSADRVGAGFGTVGAAFAPRDGFDRLGGALDLVRPDSGGHARGTVYSATANWLEVERGATAFRNPAFGTGLGEHHATLSATRYQGPDSGAPPHGLRLGLSADHYTIPGITGAVLPGLSLSAWRTGRPGLAGPQWSTALTITAGRTLVYATAAPGAQTGVTLHVDRSSARSTTSLDLQDGALWSCGTAPPTRAPQSNITPLTAPDGCRWAGHAAGMEGGWTYRGDRALVDLRARLTTNIVPPLSGIDAAPGLTVSHIIERDRLDASGVRGLVAMPLGADWFVGLSGLCDATGGRFLYDDLTTHRASSAACALSSSLTRRLW